MAYYSPQKPRTSPPQPTQSEETGPGIQDVLDLGQGAAGGFWQGLSGRNLTYEQWLRERKRRKQGFPVPNRSWLQRLLKLK